MDNIPLPAWQQISIVIVYSILALGMGYGLLRLAERAFVTSAEAFGRQLSASNRQWQAYFDAHTEALSSTNQELLQLLVRLNHAIETGAHPSVRKPLGGKQKSASARRAL